MGTCKLGVIQFQAKISECVQLLHLDKWHFTTGSFHLRVFCPPSSESSFWMLRLDVTRSGEVGTKHDVSSHCLGR